MLQKLELLESATYSTQPEGDALALAKYSRDHVYLAMLQLREIVDELETVVSKKHWPFPTYGEMLYSVN